MKFYIASLASLVLLIACSTNSNVAGLSSSASGLTPGAYVLSRVILRPKPNAVDRRPAAEAGHNAKPKAPAVTNAEAKAVASKYIEEMDALVRVMQDVDPKAKKLKAKIGVNRFNELLDETSTDSLDDGKINVKAFRDFYVGEFPNEAETMDGLMARVIANQQKDVAEGEEVILQKFIQHDYEELSKDLVMPANPTAADYDKFLGTYYGRLTAKMKTKKLSAGYIFILATAATHNMPEIDLTEGPAREGSKLYVTAWSKHIRAFMVEFGQQTKTQNFFQPLFSDQFKKLEQMTETGLFGE